MSYCHMFYAVDLKKLRSIAGSKDPDLVEQIAGKADELDEEESDALTRIIMGDCEKDEDTEYLYGYALKAICEQIGEPVGGDVAAVRDHPYKSKLIANGPPIDIPYSGTDFPEIGYLSHAELAQEYDLATKTKPKANMDSRRLHLPQAQRWHDRP